MTFFESAEYQVLYILKNKYIVHDGYTFIKKLRSLCERTGFPLKPCITEKWFWTNFTLCATVSLVALFIYFGCLYATVYIL